MYEGEGQESSGDKIDGTVGSDAGTVGVGKGITQQVSRTGDIYLQVGTQISPQRKPTEEEDSTLTMTVEEELRRKLIEHELKLGQLGFLIERNDIKAQDYIRDLQEDVSEMRAELKPLVGMGIPSLSESKSSPNWITLVSATSFWLIGISVLIMSIYLITSGGS